VSSFQRFDTDTVPQLSERDIKRRWHVFHQAIHDRSGKKWQRVLGRILGEETIRYKVARFVGRPPLQLVRKLKGRTHETVTVVKVDKGVFPHNYRPKPLAPVEVDAVVAELLGAVEVLVVDEASDEAVTTVERLNAAIDVVSAEWVCLVDSSIPTDEQTAALVALLGEARDEDDVVFCDELGPNPNTPIFKSPAVAPHTLLSYNTVGRPALLRVATLRRVRGFSPNAGWAFEHDLYLRLSELKARFRYVGQVLTTGRPAIAFSAPHVDDDSVRVVEAALERRGLLGRVTPRELPGTLEWVVAPPSPPPSIDVIIPTRDRIDLVRQCIEAIETKSTYTNYDIIILDNDSQEPASLEYFAKTKYRVVDCAGPFNYAKIVNRGVRHSSADFVVTLNNDTVLVTPDWLERMVGLASIDDVGFVGACLLDQDGRSEHESIVIAPYPQHLRSDSNYPHRDQFISAIRDVAAVTGAVQMVQRDLWVSLGGMDEQLKVTMNDVDICLRSQLEGYFVVYTPDVQLRHHVSSSRGKLDPLEDRNRFLQRWDVLGTFRDPFFPASIQLLGETMYYIPPTSQPNRTDPNL
jgi:GT2 family glycosyltransferase